MLGTFLDRGGVGHQAHHHRDVVQLQAAADPVRCSVQGRTIVPAASLR